jgi:1,4-dihydroxy-2-naphthoate octaprenyltransferase
MATRRIGLIWLIAAVLFFIAAVVRVNERPVFIALGTLSFCLGVLFQRKRAGR